MFTLKAPAKINWYLRVLGKRRDGFHDISSLMQCVSLYDELTFETHEDVTIETDAPIPYEQNLAYRAAMLLREEVGAAQGVRLRLKKNIPLQAGLGGGSSDAATTLIGLNKLWSLGLPNQVLSALAARLGSDVPFFINGPAAQIGGRGEKVTPVKISKALTVLLMKPDIGVSSAWAYGKVKKFASDDPGLPGNAIAAIGAAGFERLSLIAINDLEPSVGDKYPEVARLRSCALDAGASFAAMSGSGPTVLAVFKSGADAERAARACRPHWHTVVRTLVK